MRPFMSINLSTQLFDQYSLKFNRWSKNGTIQRIFEELQSQNIIDVQSKILCLDSTSFKIYQKASRARMSNGEQNLIKKLEIWRELFGCETSLCSCRIWARHCVSRLSTQRVLTTKIHAVCASKRFCFKISAFSGESPRCTRRQKVHRITWL